MGEDCECLLPGERAAGGELGIPGFRRNCGAGGARKCSSVAASGEMQGLSLAPVRRNYKVAPRLGVAAPFQCSGPGQAAATCVPNGEFATIVDGTID